MSKGIDAERFLRYRAVEIKHGRVAMLAVTGTLIWLMKQQIYIRTNLYDIGYVFQEFNRLPGYIAPGEGLKFADVPNGIAALSSIPFLGWCVFYT